MKRTYKLKIEHGKRERETDDDDPSETHTFTLRTKNILEKKYVSYLHINII